MSDTAYPSVNDLTLEEKASLTSGGDAWHLQGVETKGIPGYMITDGPHGLRKSLASSTGETDPPPASRRQPACPAPGTRNSSTRSARPWRRNASRRRWPSSSAPESTSSAIRSAAAASNIGPKTRIWPAMRQSASSPACSPRAWAPRQNRPAMDHHVLLQPHQRRAFRTKPLAAHRRAARRMGV